METKKEKRKFGPYSVPTSSGSIGFFVEASSLEEADELATKKAEKIEKKQQRKKAKKR